MCPKGTVLQTHCLQQGFTEVKGHGQAGEAWAEEVVRPTVRSTGKAEKAKEDSWI